MLKPIQQDSAFLTDVNQHRADTDSLHLWWLGQSGFLVSWGGSTLVIDPYLSDSLTIKYADTDMPHTRITEQVVDPGQLDFVDVVTSSHNHTDHLDAATLIPLLKANPAITLIVPEANRAYAADKLKLALDRLTTARVGMPVEAAGFRFHAVPAAHTELDQDENGLNRYVGYVIEAGPWVLYHSGDTIWYDGIVETLKQWQIDIAILPINGNRPELGVAGNLNGEEAVRLARKVGMGLVIPCHYDMFEFNTASPDAFIVAAEAATQPYRVLRNGEHYVAST